MTVTIRFICRSIKELFAIINC